LNAFILDNTINSRADLGIRITKPPVVSPAKRVVRHITVDGREGSLTMKRGWEDVEFAFNAALLGANGSAAFKTVLPKLLNAKTVYFSNDKDVYYNVKNVQCVRLEQRLQSLYEFSLTFTCSPFQYIRNVSPITLTASRAVTNIGTVHSLPRITVYGTGSRTLTINGKPIILNILSGHLILDSELKMCHFGSVAQNNQMQGDFPVLEVGSNIRTARRYRLVPRRRLSEP